MFRGVLSGIIYVLYCICRVRVGWVGFDLVIGGVGDVGNVDLDFC